MEVCLPIRFLDMEILILAINTGKLGLRQNVSTTHACLYISKNISRLSSLLKLKIFPNY
jgi:hypothetical protein